MQIKKLIFVIKMHYSLEHKDLNKSSLPWPVFQTGQTGLSRRNYDANIVLTVGGGRGGRTRVGVALIPGPDQEQIIPEPPSIYHRRI